MVGGWVFSGWGLAVPSSGRAAAGGGGGGVVHVDASGARARWMPLPRASPKGGGRGRGRVVPPLPSRRCAVHRQRPRPLLLPVSFCMTERWSRAGAGPGRQSREPRAGAGEKRSGGSLRSHANESRKGLARAAAAGATGPLVWHVGWPSAGAVTASAPPTPHLTGVQLAPANFLLKKKLSISCVVRDAVKGNLCPRTASCHPGYESATYQNRRGEGRGPSTRSFPNPIA